MTRRGPRRITVIGVRPPPPLSLRQLATEIHRIWEVKQAAQRQAKEIAAEDRAGSARKRSGPALRERAERLPGRLGEFARVVSRLDDIGTEPAGQESLGMLVCHDLPPLGPDERLPCERVPAWPWRSSIEYVPHRRACLAESGGYSGSDRGSAVYELGRPKRCGTNVDSRA